MSKPRVMLIGLDGANPDLIRHYVNEGVMPNFKKLMERGVFGEYLSAVPPNTTVNWTTIATVAHPGTHGITDFWPHFPGTPLDQVDDAFPKVAGSEDFAYMLEERPGAYLFLGAGEGAMVHHPKYNFNDEISPIGASFFVKVVETAQPVGAH